MGHTGDITLLKVEVWAGKKLAEIEGKELGNSIRRTGPEEGSPTLLRAGVRGIANLFLVDTVPDLIEHKAECQRFGFEESGYSAVRRGPGVTESSSAGLDHLPPTPGKPYGEQILVRIPAQDQKITFSSGAQKNFFLNASWRWRASAINFMNSPSLRTPSRRGSEPK